MQPVGLQSLVAFDTDHADVMGGAQYTLFEIICKFYRNVLAAQRDQKLSVKITISVIYRFKELRNISAKFNLFVY